MTIFAQPVFADGACKGETYCTVCTDCSRCWHCSVEGNSCGVCFPESRDDRALELAKKRYDQLVFILETDRQTSLYFRETSQKKQKSIAEIREVREIYQDKVVSAGQGDIGFYMASFASSLHPDEVDRLVRIAEEDDVPPFLREAQSAEEKRSLYFLSAFRFMTKMQTERLDAWLDFLAANNQEEQSAAFNRVKQATESYNTLRLGIEGMVQYHY